MERHAAFYSMTCCWGLSQDHTFFFKLKLKIRLSILCVWDDVEGWDNKKKKSQRLMKSSQQYKFVTQEREKVAFILDTVKENKF